MKYILFFLILFIAGCMHKKDHWIIKAQDGKIYQLNQAVPDEAYFLTEIDTNAIKNLKP